MESLCEFCIAQAKIYVGSPADESRNAVMAFCKEYSHSPPDTSIKTFRPVQPEAKLGIVRYFIDQLDKPQHKDLDRHLVASR